MPECCADTCDRLRNFFYTQVFVITVVNQTVLLFVAHFHALMADTFGIVALFQVLIGEKIWHFGTLSGFT